MDIFPTRYSTLSSAALKDFLENSYGFNGMECRLLIRNVSDTYILENASEKFIFKIYRDAHRKLEEIEAEVELLNRLKERGANVAYPITDLQGKQIQQFNAAEGVRNGVLFSYALGQVVYNLNDEQLAVLGREMAMVHNITAGIKLTGPRKEYTIETTIINPLEILKPAFTNLETEYIYLKKTGLKVIEKLNQFHLANFSYGYCHYDLLPKNFHFTGDGKVTFFDFDFAGKGYLANDITTFYIHYFLEVTHNKITKEQADRSFHVFLESYRKLRPVTNDEIRAIPYLGFAFWLFYLGFAYENFEDWSNIFFGDRFLKERVALIKKWMTSFED